MYSGTESVSGQVLKSLTALHFVIGQPDAEN